MNSSLEKRAYAYLAKRIYLILGILCMFGAVTLTANAIMTVSSSAIVGSSDVIVDATGTLNLGTSSSTAVVIGQTSVPVTIPGSLNVVETLSLGSASSTTGQLLFHIASSTYTTTLQASSSQASSLIFTLPGTQGTAGQALLTDGTGKLYFGSASTTLPDTVVQKDANGNVSIGNTVPAIDAPLSIKTKTVGDPATDPQADGRGMFFWNAADEDMHNVLRIQGGLTHNVRRYLNWTQFDGTPDWMAGVNANSDFIIFHHSGIHPLFAQSPTSGGALFLQATGPGPIKFNYDPNASASGLEFWSGGASPVMWGSLASSGLVMNLGLPIKTYNTTNTHYIGLLTGSATGYVTSDVDISLKAGSQIVTIANSTYAAKFTFNASTGVQTNAGLAGTGNAPVCVDANGVFYRGNNTAGAVPCP